MAQARVLGGKDAYLAAYDEFKSGAPGADGARDGSWIAALRRNGAERFADLGFPTLRDEQWRQTNVAPIVAADYRLAPDGALDADAALALADAICEELDCVRLVFVNGRYHEGLSRGRAESGARVLRIRDAIKSGDKGIEARLGSLIIDTDDAFIALNTAFLTDGVAIMIDRKAEIKKPIHIINLGATDGTVSHPRTLILAGEASRATVIETYAGVEGRAYFTNAVTEIHCGPRAWLDHYLIQRESAAAHHIGALEVTLETGATFANRAISFGAAIGRNNIHAMLNGEHCELTLNGLYFAHDRQHLDTHTKIDHAKPNCHSHELYKGILDDDASGVFNGWIHVHQDAQKTDAIQSNRTLLLSERATINTQPQLEIYADDVKCTHGATVGMLSEDSVFYLRSRGIPVDEARRMLIFAFANDIIGEVRAPELRASLERVALERFSGATSARGQSS